MYIIKLYIVIQNLDNKNIGNEQFIFKYVNSVKLIIYKKNL